MLWYVFDDAAACRCSLLLFVVYSFVSGYLLCGLMGGVCGVWLRRVVVNVRCVLFVVAVLVIACCSLLVGCGVGLLRLLLRCRSLCYGVVACCRCWIVVLALVLVLLEYNG